MEALQRSLQTPENHHSPRLRCHHHDHRHHCHEHCHPHGDHQGETPLVDCSALKAKHHEGVGQSLPE